MKKLGGSWADWLKHEFEWSEKQARNFIAVHDFTKSEGVNFTGSD